MDGTNVELIYFKDLDTANDENVETLKSSVFSNQKNVETSSQAIYRISPVVVMKYDKKGHKNHFDHLIYPKIKVTPEDMADKNNFKFNAEVDRKTMKNKWEVKLDVFNKDVSSAHEQPDSNFVDVVDADNVTNDIDLKTPEEEDDPRKHLDKFNLFRGFQFSMDPFNIRSDLTYEDNYDNCEVKFDSVGKRVEELFGISQDN